MARMWCNDCGTITTFKPIRIAGKLVYICTCCGNIVSEKNKVRNSFITQSVRIPIGLYLECNKLIEKGYFTNLSEMVRFALTLLVDRYRPMSERSDIEEIRVERVGDFE
mgnify:CR=1 FL=1